jgi:outer membrane lipoprotein carrier protein
LKVVPVSPNKISALQIAGAKGWLAAAAAVLLFTGPASVRTQVRPDVPAEEFARRVQEKVNGIRDFSADFVQSYEGGVLRKRTTERGRVLIKKPGRMRWTYTAPEEKLFVADGTRMYFWVPADKQVVVRNVPRDSEAATPLLFLTGRGELVRDFVVSYTTLAQAPPDTVALKLVPRRQERDYDWLTLVVDRQSLALRMLVAGDSQGGVSTFSFSNLKENVGLPDGNFTFKVPRGADVVTQ